MMLACLFWVETIALYWEMEGEDLFFLALLAQSRAYVTLCWGIQLEEVIQG